MARFPLLPRKKNTDKSHYGHVLVLGGSRGLSGAPILAARAALAAGAGLVTLAVPAGLQSSVAKKAIPEIMTLGVGRGSAFHASGARAVRAFIRKRRVNCAVLGPGISLGAQAFARAVVRDAVVPIVLDADGINAFKGRAGELSRHGGPLVLTPHAKEFERVFSKKTPAAAAASVRAVVVCKGHHTVVTDGKKTAINRTGNPGMAKGGSGDVLSGIVGAFLAQGLTPFEAAKWAAYFHGRAGDLAVRKKSQLGMLASDLIDYLPKAFRAGEKW